jgi:manganese oxidase
MADHNHDQHQSTAHQPGHTNPKQPPMPSAANREGESKSAATSTHGDGAHAGQGTSKALAPASDGHAGMGHADRQTQQNLAHRPTPTQITAVSLLSVLVLAGALLFSALYANLTLSARDVGGAVMPPGMIMLRDTPGEAMRDMAAVDPRTVSYTAPADAQGDQTLTPRIENGVKVFDIATAVIRWNILPYEQVMAYAFNQQVPGPRLRVTEGDRLRINVKNNLPESTTVHWHGLILPNAMDGPAEITQEPIPPGGAYTYEFTTQQRGTYFYHTHDHPDRQQALGLYGALIIDPKDPAATPAYDLEYTIQLQEWLEREGYTFPAMLMEGGLPNFFTINGKAYPATNTIEMKVGQKVRLRFIGSNNNFIHPMHVHGGPFTIIETDGNPVPATAQIEKDTINVGPGERYDVIWTAREPGKWLIHCHIPHHTTNDNVEEEGAGGLTMLINVTS